MMADAENRHCVVHNKACKMPSTLTGYSAGFSCTSYSKLNKDSKKNATAMQRAQDAGDDGVRDSEMYFDRIPRDIT